MKKTLKLPLILLSGVTCFSAFQGIQKVEAKVPAAYEANIKPVNIYLEDDTKIYSDNYLYKMIDGDKTTHAWFSGRTSGIVLDYGKNFLLHDISVFSGKVAGGDHYYSAIESSLDGVTWTTLDNTEDYSGEFVFDYYAEPVETRYLRLKDLDHSSGNWVAITEFSVNQIEKRISYNNMELEDPVYGHADINDMIDDDGTTFTWFCAQTSENRELILSYNTAQEVSYIELLTAKSDSQNDYIGEVKFYYAVDDSYNWIEVDGTYKGVAMRATLSLPVMAKHVKAVAQETRENGLVVREFSTSSNSPVSLVNFKEYPNIRNSSYYPEQLNSIRNINDGNLNTHVDLMPIDGSVPSGVVYDLDIVKNVTDVTVVSNTPWGDPFSGASGKILSSIDGVNYTDITDQFNFVSETGTYTLEGANLLARFIKLETGADAWVGLTEFTVNATDLTNTTPQSKLGGQYSNKFSSSNFALRFLIPVLDGTNYEDYKVVCTAGEKEVVFTKTTNSSNLIPTSDGNLQLTVGLGDIINDYAKLVTEFTVSGYYVDSNSHEGLTGSISYSIESIVRQYLYLDLIEVVSLSDAQVEFLTDLNNRIQDLSKTTDGEKINPVVKFSVDTGKTLVIGVDAEPTVQVTKGLDYTIHYEKEEKFYSNEFPTEAGTYAMVVNVTGDDIYNDFNSYIVFTLIEEKITPTITFDIPKGHVYAHDAAVKVPVYTVSDNAPYTVRYEYGSNNALYGTEAPTEPGFWVCVVTVAESDIYNYVSEFVYYTIEEDPGEKVKPTIEYSYSVGAEFSISGTERPSFTVSEGVEYEAYFSSDDLPGKKFYSFDELEVTDITYSYVVVTVENDTYLGTEAHAWFWLRA